MKYEFSDELNCELRGLRAKAFHRAFWAVWPLVEAVALGAFTLTLWAVIVWLAVESF